MRSYISIILGFTLLALAACTRQIEEFDTVTSEGNRIVISATAAGVVTRSADTGPESTIAWVDAYVMDESYNIVHCERIDKSSAPVVGGGEFVLNQKREDFIAGEKYYIYLIANSTSPLSDAQTWSELKELTQKDEHLHLSGISGIEDLTVPTYFLMDGFAYVPSNATDNGPANLTAYVINDSQNTDDLVLKGTLKRAAAKLVLKITQGDNVQFVSELDGSFPLYSYYQLPISTLVVTPDADADFESEKQNTKERGVDNRNQSFNWSQDGKNPVLTLVGYAYAHDWTDESDNGASLLINIPLMWDKDGASANGKEAPSPVNWYEIPLSHSQKFERNRCYVINVKINAIGAEEINTPIILEDIEYVTLDWQEVKVDLGTNEARYLTLNTDLVKIYDSNFDLDQLTFTSSSPIKSIKLKDVFSHNESVSGSAAFSALELIQESDGTTEAEYETGDGVYAYYIDKFGQKIQLGTDPGFNLKITDAAYAHLTKEEILQLEKKLYQKEGVNVQYIHAEVPADQKRALNGDIHIYSPIYPIQDEDDLNWNSHFNTVRYLEFEVMNEQGLTATFRVEQTPTIVIKNEEGYFSYRSDQKYSDDQEEASHYHNNIGWKSFHLTGLMWYYEYDWTETGYDDQEEELCTQTDIQRNYQKVVKKTVGDGICEVLHYGSISAPHNFIDNRGVEVTYIYGGIHRSTVDPTGSFIRHRYYLFPGGQTEGVYKEQKVSGQIVGGYRFNSKYYFHNRGDVQGLAVGPIYEVEVNGEKRKYRKQYAWNIQPIFYNLFVSKVWKENGTDASGRTKLKGQADINSMTHAQTVYVNNNDSKWTSWGLQSYTNHRMYHIKTSNTSEDYTIGFPSLQDDGVPLNVPYNARLISPGLMIASQLGETRYQSILNTVANGKATSPSSYPYEVPVVGKFYKLAQQHCREYVETTFIDMPDANGVYNGVWDEGEEVIHYDDWRLPTKAEIDRIIEFQESSRAMDKLLVGQYYFCITGNGEDADINEKDNWVSVQVPNYTSSMTGYYIRCVRDAGRNK